MNHKQYAREKAKMLDSEFPIHATMRSPQDRYIEILKKLEATQGPITPKDDLERQKTLIQGLVETDVASLGIFELLYRANIDYSLMSAGFTLDNVKDNGQKVVITLNKDQKPGWKTSECEDE